MSETLADKAVYLGKRLVAEHPVVPDFADHLSVVVTGSVGAGYWDKHSDVDLWVLCDDESEEPFAAALRAAGYRFHEPPPHELEVDGAPIHYFFERLSHLRGFAEQWEDEALFIVSHCLIAHDPSGQFAELQKRSARVPADVLTDKVDRAQTFLRQRCHSLRSVLRRYQPLAWLEAAGQAMHAALELCCWMASRRPAATGPCARPKTGGPVHCWCRPCSSSQRPWAPRSRPGRTGGTSGHPCWMRPMPW